ncbi:hypothetical protein FAX13_08515 [Ligilactobacillus animalis]|nr:hypothetical protein FAX13_08515 [Ligilactobacillus animalis]
MDFQLLKETAKYLGDGKGLKEIEELEKVQSAGKLYLTVWGHYSAGKSKLLNKLLGQDILPTKTRETTAALTYIEYGPTNSVVITFEDGRTQQSSLDELNSIFQNTTADINTEEIRSINVTLENKLLKNGIVLVDTPGINTLLKRHNLLASSTINQSGKILYVLGGAPSNVDKKFITDISKTGTEIIFVRTKTDNIDPAEEDVREEIEFERNLVRKFVGDNLAQFTAVSNEETSEWFDNLNQLREQLKEIQKDTSKEIEHAIKSKVQIYANKYISELIERNKDINLAMTGDQEQLDHKILHKELQIENLSGRLENLEYELTNSTKRTRQKTKFELETLVDRYTLEFQSELHNSLKTKDDSKKADEVYNKFFEKLVSEVQKSLEADLNNLLSDNYPVVEGISTEPPTYQEAVLSVNSYVNDYKVELQNIKYQLEQKMIELEKLSSSNLPTDEEMQDLREQINQIDDYLKEIPKTPNMYTEEVQELKPSQIFEGAGKLIDIALLIVPGIGEGKLAKIATKMDKQIAKQLRRVHRAYQQTKSSGILDAARGFGQRVRAGRKYHDAAVEIRKGIMKQALNQSDSVLDMLDVSYWTRKLGEQFDLPPRLVVDPEEEKARVNQIDTLNAEKQRHVNDLHAKERNIERLNERKRKVQSETESLLERQKDLEHKQQVAKNEAMQRIAQESINNYINDYVAYFRKNAGELVRRMHEAYFAQALQNIALYVVKTNQELSEQLEEQKQQLSELVETSKNGTNSLEEEITRNNQWIIEFKEFSR